MWREQACAGLRNWPLLIAATLLCLGPIGTLQAESPEDSDSEIVEVETAAVRLDGRPLLSVAGTSSRPAAVRAEAISERLQAIAADDSLAADAVAAVPGPLGAEIRLGNRLIMVVTGRDAQIEGVPIDVLSETHRQQIIDAIERYRKERRPDQLVRGVLIAAGASAVLLAALALSAWLLRRAGGLLDRRYLHRQGTAVADALRVAPVLQAMRSSVSVLRVIVAILLILIWVDVVFAQFPWTRWLSENLAALLFDPLLTIGTGIIGYIPSLLFLVVLGIVARFGLRMLRLYFGALERGAVSLPNFEPEWSLATYKIIRVVVIAIVLVMAYPYLPGAGSDALQGLSVFAGLLISLGASSSVSNVIAGYITTFGRVLRVGDLIEVGGVRGVVTQIRLLTVRLRTIRNEEVTIPNAVLQNSSVINFSALSRDGGLILQTEVGINYEVPWRQVHAMLLEAARRTPDLLAEPAPFVLQRSLGDFAVVYQLNVYKAKAEELVQSYSALHQNILDVFNEYGVQIMTPAYEGDPEIPKVVARERWYAEPAAPQAAPGRETSGES
ncbi:MAG: mechanosensitive ion channel family protein [Gammaproteobacteria bacterium]|jgi:small-conductance mechanosensitive channel|nr:mechanosensitive ion channel family protein [Gammaproteobacteria bacterium]